MTDVECERCGTVFDTDRDPGHYGSSERCPYCGTRAALEDDQEHVGDEPTPATATVATGEGTVVRVTVEIDPAG